MLKQILIDCCGRCPYVKTHAAFNKPNYGKAYCGLTLMDIPDISVISEFCGLSNYG